MYRWNLLQIGGHATGNTIEATELFNFEQLTGSLGLMKPIY